MVKRLLCGIGNMDLSYTRYDVSNKTLRYREYMLWRGMIYRCYGSSNVRDKTYIGSKVCSRWLLFSNFVEDIKHLNGYELWLNNPNCRVALDKDILGKYHSYYAPQYCMFVTMAENNRERNERCGCPILNPDTIAKRVVKYSHKILATEISTNRIISYPSVRECARQIKGYSANILHCLKGRRLTYKGYKFAYDLVEG